MSIIPQAVFNKYGEFVDHMTDDFGITCTLIYAEQVEIVSNTLPTFKQKKTMDLRKSASQDFARGDVEYKTVETTENVTMRVYFDKKDFKKFGNINLPDGSIICYGKLNIFDKITKASYLKVLDTELRFQDYKFEKAAEPTIHGLNANYFISYWKRA